MAIARWAIVQSEIPLHSPSLRLEGDLEQPLRVEDVHSTWHKGEVVHTTIAHRELAEEHAFGVPSAVVSARVHH